MSDDPESRILVVSASLDQARAAVKLIKALVNDTSDLPTSNPIPWTIRNRYYTADVHFHLVEFAHWDPKSSLRGVPAVIFVWARGQPYAEHVFALRNGLSRFEPEVTLAIALGHDPPHDDDPPEGPDAFLADHGFEYVDGERTHRPEMNFDSGGGDGDGNEEGDDVPGLPRVTDALSTIMWPTMVRVHDSNNNSDKSGGGKGKGQPRLSLFDFDDDALLRAGEGEGEEETLAALMEADATDHGTPQTRASRIRSEMVALERWLVENEELYEAEVGRSGVDSSGDEDRDGDTGQASPVLSIHAPSKDQDPWAAAPCTSPNPMSPTPTAAMTPRATTAPPSSGFDDDFSAFVSAPPPAISVSGGGSAATAEASTSTATTSAASGSITGTSRPRLPTQTLLLPSHTGGSFHSLRSASDVDIGDDMGYQALDDHSSFGLSPEHDRARAFDDDRDDAGPRTSIGHQPLGGDRTRGLGDVPFDLTNILSSLQTMREDVAGIEDEGERRATTARFASEFVFKKMDADRDEREETKAL